MRKFVIYNQVQVVEYTPQEKLMPQIFFSLEKVQTGRNS
jgi:hypothetical protein